MTLAELEAKLREMGVVANIWVDPQTSEWVVNLSRPPKDRHADWYRGAIGKNLYLEFAVAQALKLWQDWKPSAPVKSAAGALTPLSLKDLEL